MPRAHSNDLRDRVVHAYLWGEAIGSVAAHYGVSVSSVPEWRATRGAAAWRRTGWAAAVPRDWRHTGIWFPGWSARRRI